MKIDDRKLNTEEQAFIRRIAGQRVLDGESPTKVIRNYGLSDRAIFPWLRKAKQAGLESLKALLKPGRDRTLSVTEEQEEARWIVSGDPRQYGFDFGLWTRQIISDLIEHRLGVRLGLNSVGRLLHRQGITPQMPLRRGYERNEVAVQSWVDNEYPKIQIAAKKQGAEIYWMDEAAIHSDDPLGRTWGLRGKTPVLKTSGQRQSINAISALSNKGGFWYQLIYGAF